MKWFAWHPVKLTNGNWVWLCEVKRHIWLHHFGGEFYYTE